MTRNDILSALDSISSAVGMGLSLTSDFQLAHSTKSSPVRVYIQPKDGFPEIGLFLRPEHICLNDQIAVFFSGPGSLLVVLCKDSGTGVLSMFVLDSNLLTEYSLPKIADYFPRQLGLHQLYPKFKSALKKALYLQAGVWTPLQLG